MLTDIEVKPKKYKAVKNFIRLISFIYKNVNVLI